MGGLNPNPPMDGARTGEGGKGVTGAFGGTDVGLQWLWRTRWQDRPRQEALADRDGVSWGGRSVDRMTGQWQKGAVKLGVEWLAAGSGRD